jgi:hypothetical protein
LGGGAVEFVLGGLGGRYSLVGFAVLGVETIDLALRRSDSAAQFFNCGLFYVDLGGGFFEFGRCFAALTFQVLGRDRLPTAAAGRLPGEIIKHLEPLLGSLHPALCGAGACQCLVVIGLELGDFGAGRLQVSGQVLSLSSKLCRVPDLGKRLLSCNLLSPAAMDLPGAGEHGGELRGAIVKGVNILIDPLPGCLRVGRSRFQCRQVDRTHPCECTFRFGGSCCCFVKVGERRRGRLDDLLGSSVLVSTGTNGHRVADDGVKLGFALELLVLPLLQFSMVLGTLAAVKRRHPPPIGALDCTFGGRELARRLDDLFICDRIDAGELLVEEANFCVQSLVPG